MTTRSQAGVLILSEEHRGQSVWEEGQAGNSHNAEPRLLVLHPCSCGCDALDDIQQQVD